MGGREESTEQQPDLYCSVVISDKQPRVGLMNNGKARNLGSPGVYAKTGADKKQPIKLVRSSSTGPNSASRNKQGQFPLKIPPVMLNEEPEGGKRLSPLKRSNMVQQ